MSDSLFKILTAKPTCSCGCGSADTANTCAPPPSSVNPEHTSHELGHEHGHKHAHGNTTDHEHGHSHSPSSNPQAELVLLVCIAVLFALILIFEASLESLGGAWLSKGLLLLLYAICGLPVLKEACSLVLRKDIFNEFTLMSLATLVAIALGETPEAVGVMLFYRVGEWVQDKAAGSSRRSIQKLLASKPVQARLMQNGQEDMVPVETVEVGQEVIVRAGEKIPLDGEVIQGLSDVDQSPLTGESLPLPVTPGTKVLGGSINLSGALTVRVESRFAESHMARIIDMIEHASQRKSRTERFITRFARYYTPAVTALALLVAVVPPLLIPGALFSEWVYRGLILLVISCPCALLISVPLGYFGGIGMASKSGILIKGGNVFDEVLNITSVVFDKTGTLTKGSFSVAQLTPASGVQAQDLLQGAAIAEFNASHPIARAVLAYAQEHGLSPATLMPAGALSRELPGKGMAVTAGNTQYLAGTFDLLTENGVQPIKDQSPGAVVYVAKNTVFLGSIVVADTLKPDSKAAIDELRAQGLTTYMLTGDREEAAKPIAQALGLDGYRAGLLPEGKVAALEELGGAKNLDNPEKTYSGSAHTLFVGDGINDAPILALSRVGVAMGGIGAEAAIEAADVVILNDSPRMVAKLLGIARRVRSIVWQNIALALGVKAIVMIMGIAGESNLWEAVFADVGVALLAVLNSTRTTWKV